mmetsp:Transcript_4763/g.13244  ORF Transcript_4763/g.13244 Transcript_4763/m.13244 type:complete len:80 (-) Transcript_4763:593-832(-)
MVVVYQAVSEDTGSDHSFNRSKMDSVRPFLSFPFDFSATFSDEFWLPFTCDLLSLSVESLSCFNFSSQAAAAAMRPSGI